METSNTKDTGQLGGVPWISFCVATYRRPEILAKTLRSIQTQHIDNFEVVVSDNDPEQSSRKVVEDIGDARFRYFGNNENVGMVKNFNAALSRARGDYVVLLADDDPPYTNFLSEIHAIWSQFPNYGAYYGACEVSMEHADAAAAYKVKVGKIKCLAPVPEGTIRCFSKEEFPVQYFEGKVFPYILWSTGIVRRDIALEIGGMPDYGSPLLTDISYIAVAGGHSGCVTINKILGGQTVHGANSGLVDPHNVEIALKGSHQYLFESFTGCDNWQHLREAMEKYLCAYIVSHSLAMDRYFAVARNKIERKKLKETLQSIAKLPFMNGVMYQFSWPRVNLLVKTARIYAYRILSIKLIKKVLSPIKKSLLGQKTL